MAASRRRGRVEECAREGGRRPDDAEGRRRHSLLRIQQRENASRDRRRIGKTWSDLRAGIEGFQGKRTGTRDASPDRAKEDRDQYPGDRVADGRATRPGRTTARHGAAPPQTI